MYTEKPSISPKKLTKKFCDSPWKTVVIGASGAIFSCTCSNWTNLKLGNILNQSLSEIYQNSVHLGLLKNGVLKGTYDWCIESVCSKIQNLPTYIENPFIEFNVESNPKLPTDLVLAIDSNCNLKCPSCRIANIFSNKPNPATVKILDILHDDYKNFDKQVLVMLDGAGDIFVSAAYHNFLFNKLPKCWKLNITTNGNLLLKKQNEIKNITSQIDMITVSLDAGTKETYAITRGGNFDNVLDGVKMLKDLGINVHLQFVLQQSNYKELIAYKKIANNLQVGYGVQKINYWEHMTKQYWESAKLEDNPKVDYVLLREQLMELSNDKTCVLNGAVRWLMMKF